MEEITASHLVRFSTFGGALLYTRLDFPKPPSSRIWAILKEDFGLEDCAHVEVSRAAHIHARAVHGGDVCLYNKGSGASVGQVWIHASIQGQIWSCLVPWEYPSRDGHVAKYVVGGTPVWLRAGELLESLIFTKIPEGSLSRMIVPAHVGLELC